jgi:hypothetical protein
MAAANQFPQGFPNNAIQFVDPLTGVLTLAGQRFLLAIFNRTGGTQGSNAGAIAAAGTAGQAALSARIDDVELEVALTAGPPGPGPGAELDLLLATEPGVPPDDPGLVALMVES